MKTRFQTRAQKAFTLVEVVLAVGVLAVSVLAMMGLMGPAFRQVRTITDNNAAVGVISKFNAVIQEASFDTIYQLTYDNRTIARSTSGGKYFFRPTTVMLFYTEENFGSGSGVERHRDRVAVMGLQSTSGYTKNGWQRLSDLRNAANPTSGSEWRAMPPVFALVISLSPMIKDLDNNFTYTNPEPNKGAPTIFPSYTSLPASPTSYNYGMLPLMVSVFTVPNLVDDISANELTEESIFTKENRLFTFQAVKLR